MEPVSGTVLALHGEWDTDKGLEGTPWKNGRGKRERERERERKRERE